MYKDIVLNSDWDNTKGWSGTASAIGKNVKEFKRGTIPRLREPPRAANNT